MPIYMDRHDVSEMVTAENVAFLHQEDLKIQDQFNCRGLTYWFDEKRKMAFCLIEAPDKKTLLKMHEQAHGQVPNQVIEVEPSIVESFLGRIEDPEKAGNAALNIIDDPAFRIIMLINAGDIYGLPSWPKLHDSIRELMTAHKGNIVDQKRTSLLASFKSVQESVNAALKIQNFLRDNAYTLKKNGHLKIALTAGVPVTDRKLIFEETIQLAERMCKMVNSEIILSSSVTALYNSEHAKALTEHQNIRCLSEADEKFLNLFMSFTAEHWSHPDLKVDDFTRPMACSKSRLYRNLMSLAGESPNSFIRNYRLEQAVNLLSKNSKTVAEIAFETGFTTPSYFTKCFQKRYSTPPSEYFHRPNADR